MKAFIKNPGQTYNLMENCYFPFKAKLFPLIPSIQHCTGDSEYDKARIRSKRHKHRKEDVKLSIIFIYR